MDYKLHAFEMSSSEPVLFFNFFFKHSQTGPLTQPCACQAPTCQKDINVFNWNLPARLHHRNFRKRQNVTQNMELTSCHGESLSIPECIEKWNDNERNGKPANQAAVVCSFTRWSK